MLFLYEFRSRDNSGPKAGAQPGVPKSTPAHRTDAATVLRLREVAHSPSVRSALERGSDTLPAFALREVARVLSDYSQTYGETIVRIRNLVDEPHLNEALGFPQNRRTITGPHPTRRWWE